MLTDESREGNIIIVSIVLFSLYDIEIIFKFFLVIKDSGGDTNI